MNKWLGVIYLALIVLGLYALYWIVQTVKSGVVTVGDAVTEGAATAAEKISNAWDTVKEHYESPLDSNFNSETMQSIGGAMENPVSRFFGSLFKSDAEKKVNADLPPGVDKKGGFNLSTPTNSKPDPKIVPQMPRGIAAGNPGPGPTTTSGRITAPTYTGDAQLPRASGDTRYSGSNNPLPPVNMDSDLLRDMGP